MTDEEMHAPEMQADEGGVKANIIMKDNLEEYAFDTMSLSLVTGVSNIVKTKNKFRKLFKITVLILCTCGFFYQATEFVKYFMTYPSVVEIEVYVPEKIIAPAYTYCNNNGIKRSKFCEKYPDHCYSPIDMEDFCEHNRLFCLSLNDTSNVSLVKPEYYEYENNVTFEELQELGHELPIFRTNSSLIEIEEESGPTYVRKSDGVYILCYTAYLRVDSDVDARQRGPFDRFNKTLEYFTFDLEPEEVFQPDRKPGALFNIHSPFIYEDPFENGIFLSAEQIYIVHMRMEEEHLLPYPYRSDCMNYTELWLSRGRKGHRSQEMCKEKCLIPIALSDCNCIFPEILFPNNGPHCVNMAFEYCHPEHENALNYELEKCTAECKDDCHKMKYRYDYQKRMYEAKGHEKMRKHSYTGRTEVKIIATESEVVKYKYRPQYQVLEVFSYVGGFIGAWMGISLVAVVDMIESLVMIATFCFRKKPMRKNEDENNVG